MRSAALVVLLATAVAAQGPRELRSLESAARGLASKGHAEAVALLRAVLIDLGQSERAARNLERTCTRNLTKAKKRNPNVSRERKTIQGVAERIAARLEELPGSRRQTVAKALVRIDSSLAAAQALLGRVPGSGGRWVTPEEKAWLARRTGIEEALRRARRIEVPTERDPAGHPLLERIEGRSGWIVRSNELAFASNKVPPEVLESCLRSLVRATAVSNFLRGGELKPPVLRRPVTWIVFASHGTYKLWVDHCVQTGRIRDPAEPIYEWSFYGMGSYVACRQDRASELLPMALLTHWIRLGPQEYGSRPQACLTAGHLGWISLYFFGANLPAYHEGYLKERRERFSDAGTAVTAERLLELAQTGLYGSRAYIRFLAQQGKDPPWRKSMVDRLSSIGGTDSAKCVFVAEYFQETGRLGELFGSTAGKSRSPAEAIQGALGEPFAQFERRWRGWLLPESESDLLTLLHGYEPEPRDPATERLLNYVDDLRQKAIPQRTLEELWLDPELSEGALAHSRYLARHRDQLAKWPDAHEEYPDREGFSVAGHRAGQNSVISGGIEDPREAVDAWMGTFYHRLPLLDPWLLGVGWGLHDGVATFDCVSLAGPPGEELRVLWPPDGARGVPLGFVAELPNPVPGEDQARWGYPITLQIFGTMHTPELTLELTTDKGTKVACHLSTPARPSNPVLTPAGAWCLIPKERLRPGTRYVVRAWETAGGEEYARGAFTTGR